MRAAVLHGFGDLRVEDVPEPSAGPGEVLLEVACVQSSVTESMLVAGEPIALHDSLTARLDQGPVQFGGHEFAAVVAALGPDVAGVEVGDRVTAIETIVCDTCPACRAGERDSCSNPAYLGFTRAGAFAERLVVPAVNVVPVPPGVSAAAVAAIQPLAGALHAQEVSGMRPGDTVLVTGSGVMGLLAIQLARLGGAAQVLATGRSAAKRALATRLGADLVLDTSGGDGAAIATIMDLTGGRGVQVVIETAAGAPSAGLSGTESVATAARAVCRGGRIVLVSVIPDDARLPLATLRQKAITVVNPPNGAGGPPGDTVFDRALSLVATGRVDVESLLTHRLDSIEALPDAVSMSLHKSRYGAINPPQLHTAASWSGARPNS